MSAYLDASAILPIIVEEPTSPNVAAFLGSIDGPFVVSEFAAAEVASALSRRARAGAFDVVAVSSGLAQFDTWRASLTKDIDIQPSDLRLASQFVRRFDLGLRAPDALHTAICRRAEHDLVTLDRRLAAAASALGVRVELLA